MSEHRVSMLGASWRRLEDPALSRDRRVRLVVASLAALRQPELRSEFRAELRTQLVAIAPRIVAESAMVDIVPRQSPTAAVATTSPTQTTRPRHAGGFALRLPRVRLGRAFAIATAVVTTFALLLGGAVWMSRKALPGDTLYGLKRASEQLQLATAGSNVDKAKDYLDFARTRAGEVQALVGNANDTDTAGLIRSTLASADSDLKSASALLARQAVQSKSASPLDTLMSWAPGQLARLQEIAAALPAGPLRQHAQSSAALVSAAETRANALMPQLGCSCLGSAGSDALGPLPCTSCAAQPANPGQAGQPAQHSSGAAPGGPVAHSSAAAQQPAGASATQHGGAASGTASGSGAPGVLPTINLPLPTPSLPVSASSCGLGATLGPLGVVIGLCPIGVHITAHH
jgi:hypothetical protein